MAGSKADETLEVECKGHCECLARKAMSGKDVKASLRFSKRSPKE